MVIPPDDPFEETRFRNRESFFTRFKNAINDIRNHDKNLAAEINEIAEVVEIENKVYFIARKKGNKHVPDYTDGGRLESLLNRMDLEDLVLKKDPDMPKDATPQTYPKIIVFDTSISKNRKEYEKIKPWLKHQPRPDIEKLKKLR